MSGKDSSKTGTGCLVVFGSVFLFAGLLVGYFALSMLLDWYRARDWEPVPATITAAELQSSTSDGSTTYEVTARYRYTYAGQTHTGERVGTGGGGSDNIGSYHQDTYRILSRHRDNGEPFTAWVNPDDPSEAMLIRDMRWGLFGFMMVFPLVFGGVGALVVFGGLWAGRKARKEGREHERHPGEPWRWKEEWQTPDLRCGTPVAMWGLIGFAVIWNAISMPLLFILPEEVLDKQNYAALLGLLFPLVGVGMASAAVYMVIRWRKFGRSKFHLSTLPVPLGGTLKGELRCPTPIEAREMEVLIKCERKRTTGSGKNRSTHTTTLWSDRRRLSLVGHNQAGGIRLPIALRIPADAEPTDETDSNDKIIWTLSTRAEVPGVDYAADFQLPVFRTRQSPPADDESAYTMDQVDEPQLGDWRATGVRHALTGGGDRFYLPPMRRPVLALVMTVIGIGFSIGTWAAFVFGQWFVGVVVGLFALIFDAVGLTLLLHRSELLVSMGRLRYRSGYLWMGALKELPVDEVRQLGMEKTGSTGDRIHFSLTAERWGGEPVTLLHNLDGRRDVQALIEEIQKRAGIRPEPDARRE